LTRLSSIRKNRSAGVSNRRHYFFTSETDCFRYYLLSTVATNLDRLLEAQDVSAKELHNITGYSEAAISKYRTGKQLPPINFLCELKKLYGISIDDFLYKEISKSSISSVEVSDGDEISLYRKFVGTYIIYYLNTSDYKGRDKSTPEESLLFGILNISEIKTSFDEPTFRCICIFGIKDRETATLQKKEIEQMNSYSEIEAYIEQNKESNLSKKTYYGTFELTADHAFINLEHAKKDRALIILHRVNSNKDEYIGGMGTVNSVSKGREPMPTAQYIAFSRYPISLSAEEIHHQLLLGHPTYKADEKAKELIALFKKTYMLPDPDDEIHSELEKELTIKVNLERYVKESLRNNMFRYAKISERDDGTWYDLLKEVSVKSVTTDGESIEE